MWSCFFKLVHTIFDKDAGQFLHVPPSSGYVHFPSLNAQLGFIAEIHFFFWGCSCYSNMSIISCIVIWSWTDPHAQKNIDKDVTHSTITYWSQKSAFTVSFFSLCAGDAREFQEGETNWQWLLILYGGMCLCHPRRGGIMTWHKQISSEIS